MVFVVRFIDDHWSPQQRLVRLQMLAKTVEKRYNVARELTTTLSTQLSISPGRLLTSMRDWVASNGAAMRTLKVVHFREEVPHCVRYKPLPYHGMKTEQFQQLLQDCNAGTSP